MDYSQLCVFRHAKVKFDNEFIPPNKLSQAITTYDLGPVYALSSTSDLAPCDIVLCSSLRRSTDTAQQLFSRVDVTDPLFREAELPSLPNLPLILPAKVWFAIARLWWMCGKSKDCESFEQFKHRVKQAAEKLISLSLAHQSIALVGHGFFNYYLTKELLSNGYTGPRKPSRAYGSQSLYRRCIVAKR